MLVNLNLIYSIKFQSTFIKQMGNLSTCCAGSREKHEIGATKQPDQATSDHLQSENQDTPGGSLAKDEAVDLRPVKRPKEAKKEKKEKVMKTESDGCSKDEDEL